MISDPLINTPQALSDYLLLSAAGTRCGICLPYNTIPAYECDLPGLYNAAVQPDPSRPSEGTSGAVATHPEQAAMGAIAESLERYSAAYCSMPLKTRSALTPNEYLDENDFQFFSLAQRQQTNFPWPQTSNPDDLFTQAWKTTDNTPMWVPQELIGLGPRQGKARFISTSSGLAAYTDQGEGIYLALLRAIQEILERDALSVTWINGLGGQEIPLTNEIYDTFKTRGGDVWAFDMTQAWNPHPVVAIAGTLPSEGIIRHGFGIACRANLSEAIDKAYLECAQALTFSDYMQRYEKSSVDVPKEAIKTFTQHAMFYTLHPESWEQTPLMSLRTPSVNLPPAPLKKSSVTETLQDLINHLANHHIDTYYAELVMSDVIQAGLRVVRAISPQLSLLHSDESTPFLGPSLERIDWRYPTHKKASVFPNPFPHPLG